MGVEDRQTDGHKWTDELTEMTNVVSPLRKCGNSSKNANIYIKSPFNFVLFTGKQLDIILCTKTNSGADSKFLERITT
jgi:hypothetical protein